MVWEILVSYEQFLVLISTSSFKVQNSQQQKHQNKTKQNIVSTILDS